MNNKIQNYVYCDVELLMFVAFSLYLFVSCILIVFFYITPHSKLSLLLHIIIVTLEFVAVSTLFLIVIFFFSILSASFSYFYFILVFFLG